MTLTANGSTDDGIRAYNEGNYATALKEFGAAAKRGDSVGKHFLASLYYQGHGVNRDSMKAVQLFAEAAKAGYAPSLANLALGADWRTVHSIVLFIDVQPLSSASGVLLTVSFGKSSLSLARLG